MTSCQQAAAFGELSAEPLTPQPAVRSKPPHASAFVRLQRHSPPQQASGDRGKSTDLEKASCRQRHGKLPAGSVIRRAVGRAAHAAASSRQQASPGSCIREVPEAFATSGIQRQREFNKPRKGLLQAATSKSCQHAAAFNKPEARPRSHHSSSTQQPPQAAAFIESKESIQQASAGIRQHGQ